MPSLSVATPSHLLLGSGAHTSPHASRVHLAQPLLASWLVIKACQRAVPHHQFHRAKPRKRPPRSWAENSMSISIWRPKEGDDPRSDSPISDWLSAPSCPIEGVQLQSYGKSCLAINSCVPSLSCEGSNLITWKTPGRNTFSPHDEQMPCRSGPSFVNDFKVYLSAPRRLLESPTVF